jgi:hypothetical protein
MSTNYFQENEFFFCWPSYVLKTLHKTVTSRCGLVVGWQKTAILVLF